MTDLSSYDWMLSSEWQLRENEEGRETHRDCGLHIAPNRAVFRCRCEYCLYSCRCEHHRSRLCGVDARKEGSVDEVCSKQCEMQLVKVRWHAYWPSTSRASPVMPISYSPLSSFDRLDFGAPCFKSLFVLCAHSKRPIVLGSGMRQRNTPGRSI